jgi:predicted RNase H-like HicB family nuclease
MNPYPFLLEKTETGYGAWAPDLPGCVAAGATLEETRRLMREAIRLHIESLREHGEPVPEPATLVEYAEAAP